MIIGGFHPLSLSDYPGIPAAVIFTQGCNWNCWYCHNKQLLPAQVSEEQYDEQVILTELTKRKSLIKGVVITGGEPTLQPDLIPFLTKVKAMGYLVKLDTNGTHPEVVDELVSRKLPDFIAMDIKGPWEKYELIVGRKVQVNHLKQSMQLIINSQIAHQFRTTFEPRYLTSDDLDGIKKSLPETSMYTIQSYQE